MTSPKQNNNDDDEMPVTKAAFRKKVTSPAPANKVGGRKSKPAVGSAEAATSGSKAKQTTPSSKEVDDALDQVDLILDLIDEVPDSSKRHAQSFFVDVSAHVTSVGETIERTNRVSARQQQALDNWEAAIKKWHPEHRKH